MPSAVTKRVASQLGRIPTLDCALAIALTLSAQVEIWVPAAAIGIGDVEGSRPLLSVTSLLITLPLAVRRTAPLLSNAVVMGGAAVQALLTVPTDGLTLLIALLLSAYSVAAYCDRRRAAVGGVFALAAIAASAHDLADWGFAVLILGAASLAGRAVRRRSSQVETLDARARALEQEQESAARQAVEEERARIARELHDIVSHRVSTMVVQAQAADALLASDLSAARDALHAIDEGGRQALTELRVLLGLLRDDEHDTDRYPSPDLDRLPELIDQTRAAGVPVSLRVDGTPFHVPPGIGVAAYRIVQEALTNVLKHAGAAPTEVVVRYDADVLEIVVADHGARPVNGRHTGHGLVGMRERVGIFGGSIEAGPRAEGGFAVRARLPIEQGLP
jgi:signal transduction histidine kinase